MYQLPKSNLWRMTKYPDIGVAECFLKYLLNLHNYQAIHTHLLDPKHTMLKPAIKRTSDTFPILDDTGL